MNKSVIRKIVFRSSFLKNRYIQLSKTKNKIVCWHRLGVPILVYKKKSKQHHPVFLIFTPEHANLGDHAIALSEINMLREMGIDFFELTGRQLEMLADNDYLKLLNGCSILVNGGGNLGLLWPDIDKLNKRIIRDNNRSRICFLPNSIYYPDNDYGFREMAKSMELFNRHEQLTLMAREIYSYQLMSQIYKRVILFPDMVMYLNQSENKNIKRKGCLISFRQDIEKVMPDKVREKCIRFARDNFSTVHFYDTVRPVNISPINREDALNDCFKIFRESELVITDRLHGMIFAAITGTKCLVFEGKGKKIRGCYEWIKNLGYIRLVTNEADLDREYLQLKDYPNDYSFSKRTEYYNDLKREIYHCVYDS